MSNTPNQPLSGDIKIVIVFDPLSKSVKVQSNAPDDVQMFGILEMARVSLMARLIARFTSSRITPP